MDQIEDVLGELQQVKGEQVREKVMEEVSYRKLLSGHRNQAEGRLQGDQGHSDE